MTGDRPVRLRRTALLALIVWILVASGCAGRAPDSIVPKSVVALSNSVTSKIGNRPFVYRSGTELVLSTAQGVIARHPGDYTDAGFVRDNSHVYALDKSGVLAAVRVAGGVMLPERVACHCDRIFPLRGSVVGWWQEPDIFVQADLRDPDSVVRMTVSLPSPRDSIAPGNVLSTPRLLAADERTLVFAQAESPPGASWGINHLSLVDIGTGAVRQVGRVGGINTAFVAAELSPDGGRVVIPGYARDGISCGTARLATLTLSDGRLSMLDPPDISGISGCSAVADLRWDDAALTVTILLWELRTPDRLGATAVWAGDSARWSRRGGNDTLRSLTLAPDIAVAIRRTDHDRVRTAPAGDLVLIAGTTTLLARGVRDIRLSNR
jgi:hypothetical protein